MREGWKAICQLLDQTANEGPCSDATSHSHHCIARRKDVSVERRSAVSVFARRLNGAEILAMTCQQSELQCGVASLIS